MLFKEVDDIVRLGKWAYLQIPSGTRCKGCPLLNKLPHQPYEGWRCELRLAYALMHDKEGPFKDDSCPRKEGV